MSLGDKVSFVLKLNGQAVSVNGVVLKDEDSRTLLLVPNGVPGVQKFGLGGHSFGATWVKSDSYKVEWASNLTAPHYAMQMPTVDLQAILDHVTSEELEVFTSATEEQEQPQRQNPVRLSDMEKMGATLQQTMMDTMKVVSGLQREVKSLQKPTSSSSVSSSLPLGSIGGISTSKTPASMRGLAKSKSLWGESMLGGLLEEEDEEEDEDEDTPLFTGMNQSQPATDQSPTQMTTDQMIQLQMLELLKQQNKKMSSKKKKKRSSGTNSSSTESSDSERDADQLRGNGFKGVRRLRQRFHRHPRRLVSSYLTRSKEIIGVHHKDQRWGFRDVSHKIKRTFGKMVGLWRCHLLLQEVLQLQMADDHLHATALVCQISKALHQVAVDKGDWDTAQLLIPLPDALTEAPFGGDEEELELVHSYKKSLRELKSKVSNRVEEGGDEGAGDAPDGAGGKGGKKGK